MGLPAYIVGNNIDANSVISSDVPDPAYPVDNLFNQRTAKPFKFSTVDGGYIEFDLGVAKTAAVIAIFNHNFTSAVSLTLKAGATPNPSTQILAPGDWTYSEQNMFAVFTSTSARYWRLIVSDGDSVENLQIGELILKTSVSLSVYWTFGFVPKDEQQKLMHETNRGVVYTYDLFSREVRDFTFDELTETEKDEFRTLHNAVNGNSTPFVLIPDIDQEEILYGRKEAGFAPQNLPDSYVNRWRYRLVFTEDSPGVTVTA